MRPWLHIAGIAGKTTSNVAVIYQQLGYFVTGSDINCLPPATDLLDQHDIPYVKGHNYRHLTKQFWQEQLGQDLDIPEQPDRAIFLSILSQSNKEYRYAKAKGVKIQTYAQALAEDLVKDESVVSVGTAGKTTTSGLLAYLMTELGLDPSYMVGAEFVDDFPAMHLGKSDWSVMEGDEFYGSQMEPHSKFFEYRPKYLLLNKIEWDHADVFPTEAEYIDNFKKLLQQMPAGGLILANAADENIRSIASVASCRLKWFAAYDEVSEFINEDGDKLYWHLQNKPEDAALKISAGEKDEFGLEVKSPLLGKYNHQNILGVIALLYELFAYQIDWDDVVFALEKFPGLQKRLQTLHADDQLVVVDDLGGPPLKVRAGLDALRSRYPDHKVIAIYEPNAGNRKQAMLEQYKQVLENTNNLIIPNLSEFDEQLLSHDRLVSELQNFQLADVSHVPTAEISDYLVGRITTEPTVVVFFSSYRLTPIAQDFVQRMTS